MFQDLVKFLSVKHVGKFSPSKTMARMPLMLNERSVWDTDVFRDLVQKYGQQKQHVSDMDRDRIEKILSIPDMIPYDVDGTMEAWLLRISLWGKINITYTNPDISVRNKSLTSAQFLDCIGNNTRNANFGMWDVEEDGLNIIKFKRSFWSIHGKNITEELIVNVDLRPDIKQALKLARKK